MQHFCRQTTFCSSLTTRMIRLKASHPSSTLMMERCSMLNSRKTCSVQGNAFLPDGKLLVAGGHVTGERSLFQFVASEGGGSWQQLPNLPEGRWYPTCTALPDGSVFVLSGSKKSGGGE